MRLTRWYILFLLLLVLCLIVLIQVGVISIAFEKLGLSPRIAMLLLFGALFGSGINIPVYRVTGTGRASDTALDARQVSWGFPHRLASGTTLIAVNLGGCVIPVGLSLYLFSHQGLHFATTLLAVTIVSLISYRFSRLIPGIGIGMPVFLAPLVSALTALVLDPANSAPLAYISGTLGVLIGADLLHLRKITGFDVAIASIGGAGTFDGIFITGIVASLLA